MSNQLITDEMIYEIMKRGLVVIGNPQIGKTMAVKVIVSEVIKRQPIPIQCKIMDVCGVWRRNFEPVLLQEINGNTREIYGGNNHILFDIELLDSEAIMAFMGKVSFRDYIMNRERKKMGVEPSYKLTAIEEAQNSLGSYSLTRKSGRLWLKLISEKGNFGLGFILIGQRAADLSTRVIERSSAYLIGQSIGDNNISKIRRIVGKSAGTKALGEPIYERVKKLNVGEFIYFTGRHAEEMKFPKYQVDTNPILWKPPKKTWYRRRIF